MGSLASRPKAPAVQTVYMPVYTPSPSISSTPPVTTSPSSSAPVGQEGSSPTMPPVAETTAARRNASLLERRRGVLSTVLTGFRGLLNQTVTSQRKSLLGE